MEPSLETQVARAKEGDKAALEEVVRGVQDLVYRLSLKMLWHPADAEDAAQEILIKLITHLSDFRGGSAFTTWVYRVACNYLLTTRRRLAEERATTFEGFADQLERGLAGNAPRVEAEGEQSLLLEEVKVGCMQGMLLCLDREHRLAYVIGEILGCSGPEGAFILDLTRDNFRQRLSRARRELARFMTRHCGLANPSARCRCEGQAAHAVRAGFLEPKRLLFGGRPARERERSRALDGVQQMDELERTVALFRSHPEYTAPTAVAEGVREIIASRTFGVLEE
jgi:RNA polymerase sigma factor (sigma-70 family)